jgi:ketosteroid isomerase-like protein
MRFFFSTCAALAAAVGVTAASALKEPSLAPDLVERSSSPLTGAAVIPFFDLPTLVANAPCTATPAIVEAIRSTLALYPLAIDGKNFNALSQVFTSNAVANYSAPLNVLTPLSTIQSVLQASLAAVTTQHAFATQLIDVLSPTSAFSVTYYTATHFGRGPFLGLTATAYGQYQDVWAKQSDATWKITHRNLVYMVSRVVPLESSIAINHSLGSARR